MLFGSSGRVLARLDWRSTATHEPQPFGLTLGYGIDFEPKHDGDIVLDTP